MNDAAAAGGGLSPEVIDVFARGLFFLANVDGIDEQEKNLIREFLEEAGSELRYEDLQGSEFSIMEAALVLETSHIRRVFMTAAIALVRADGVYSDAERKVIGEIADAFGLSNAEFGEIEQKAGRLRLE